MFKSKLIIAFATLLPCVANAQNGYWEQVTVCDYEQTQIQTPKTKCLYAGWLWADDMANPVQPQDKNKYFSNLQLANNHINCPASYYEHTMQYMRVADGSWRHILYQGYLPLNSQTHYMQTSTQTTVIPGSCRTEMVWIPLCEGCQIP